MTDFGKTVRKRLIEIDKPQNWLVSQVEARGVKCDKTYLSKVLNGDRKGQQVREEIKKILNLEGGEMDG